MKKHLPTLTLAMLLAACQSATVQTETTAETVPPVPEHQTHLDSQYIGQGLLTRPDVQRFINQRVARGGFSRAELEVFFGSAEHKQNIISIMDRPGTSRPWYEFRQNNVSGSRIQNGDRFWRNNVAVIDAVSQRYGVPSELIVAIVGIETNYGTNMGSFRVADSLSTLAFDYPRRAEFFQKELNEFLLMTKAEKRDVYSFKGSYAGAMGMPQFMPSSFRKYAVDYDGDGFHDIWNNVGDVAASVANYMKAHGWQTNGKMVVPVTLTINQELQGIIDEKTALTRTVADFKRLGVQPQEVVGDGEKAILYRLETSPGVYEYYLGLTNFYAVWQYNHSRMYVTAVRDIANGVSGDYRL